MRKTLYYRCIYSLWGKAACPGCCCFHLMAAVWLQSLNIYIERGRFKGAVGEAWGDLIIYFLEEQRVAPLNNNPNWLEAARQPPSCRHMWKRQPSDPTFSPRGGKLCTVTVTPRLRTSASDIQGIRLRWIRLWWPCDFLYYGKIQQIMLKYKSVWG